MKNEPNHITKITKKIIYCIFLHELKFMHEFILHEMKIINKLI